MTALQVTLCIFFVMTYTMTMTIYISFLLMAGQLFNIWGFTCAWVRLGQGSLNTPGSGLGWVASLIQSINKVLFQSEDATDSLKTKNANLK